MRVIRCCARFTSSGAAVRAREFRRHNCNAEPGDANPGLHRSRHDDLSRFDLADKSSIHAILCSQIVSERDLRIGDDGPHSGTHGATPRPSQTQQGAGENAPAAARGGGLFDWLTKKRTMPRRRIVQEQRETIAAATAGRLQQIFLDAKDSTLCVLYMITGTQWQMGSVERKTDMNADLYQVRWILYRYNISTGAEIIGQRQRIHIHRDHVPKNDFVRQKKHKKTSAS